MSVPQSALENPVDVTVDILNQFTNWPTTEAPEAFRIEEVSERARENSNGINLYVYSSDATTPTDFDAEYSKVEEESTVEILIYSYDSDDTTATSERVRELFEEYARDNRENTAYHTIKPTSKADNKGSKVSRRTDHYIDTVQITFERLRTPGLP